MAFRTVAAFIRAILVLPVDLKREAGVSAAQLVEDGMVVGLGTGSTVHHTIVELGRRVQAGLSMSGVPTSVQSQRLAQECGIPLTTLDEEPVVDLTIDGADEIDPELRLIKGGGGALTREKIVASASRRMVVVADASKEVDVLGSTFALPIEVIDLAKTPILRYVTSLGADARLRMRDGRAVLTDNGHPLIDAKWAAIEDPEGLELKLARCAGVVESGLFLGLCDTAFVAHPDGVRRRSA